LSNETYAAYSNSPHREFDEEKGKAAVVGSMEAIPDEWKPDAFSSSLKFNGVSHFHQPGIVYAVDIIVAVPNHK
jgi:hypothetical protein